MKWTDTGNITAPDCPATPCLPHLSHLAQVYAVTNALFPFSPVTFLHVQVRSATSSQIVFKLVFTCLTSLVEPVHLSFIPVRGATDTCTRFFFRTLLPVYVRYRFQPQRVPIYYICNTYIKFFPPFTLPGRARCRKHYFPTCTHASRISSPYAPLPEGNVTNTCTKLSRFSPFLTCVDLLGP